MDERWNLVKCKDYDLQTDIYSKAFLRYIPSRSQSNMDTLQEARLYYPVERVSVSKPNGKVKLTSCFFNAYGQKIGKYGKIKAAEYQRYLMRILSQGAAPVFKKGQLLSDYTYLMAKDPAVLSDKALLRMCEYVA